MNKLKQRREAKGWTQASLATNSGVNLRMVQKYENGEKDINKAEALTVYKLATALECDMVDLLDVEVPPKPTREDLILAIRKNRILTWYELLCYCIGYYGAIDLANILKERSGPSGPGYVEQMNDDVEPAESALP